MPKSKNKFYAVARGRKPGVYTSWSECESQVKGCSNGKYKSFKTRGEAINYIKRNTPTTAAATTTTDKQNLSLPNYKKEKSIPKHEVRTPSTASGLRICVVVHFDGGSRSNPGLGGAGAQVVVVESGKNEETDGDHGRTIQIRKYLGTHTTNNVAEYHGLLCGLNQAKAITTESIAKSNATCATLVSVQVKGDSDLIIKQLNGIYKCKHKNLVPLYEQAKSIVADMKRTANVEISFEHVYREDNKIADALANEAMDRRETWTTTTQSSTNDPMAVSKGEKRRTVDV